MNIERLQQLRRVVLEAPEDRWDMRFFAQVSPCRTAYCAAGFAAIDPWFRDNTEINQIFKVMPDENLEIREIRVCNPFNSLARLFDIDNQDSYILFGGGIYAWEDEVTKKEVIDNIDRLLSGRQPQVYQAIAKNRK